MQCLLIAGEKSGEDHALSFVPQIKEILPNVHFFGVGGDNLKSNGMEILYHLKDFSSWGVSDVISKIPFYKKALNHLVAETCNRNCKVAILIDFQSFNMKLAKELKKNNIKVLYYVAPQAWVWKSGRVKVLAKTIHTLFTIIPFEQKWFKERGVPNVLGVSHPVYLQYKNQIPQEVKKYPQDSFRILLLPGSRNSEVSHNLDEMILACKMLRHNKKIEIGIVESSSVSPAIYELYKNKIDRIYRDDQLVDALKWANSAFAASGTVTLTCALFGLPTIVMYRVGVMNEILFKILIKYRGPFSLANIVHNEIIFPEMIQEEARAFWLYSKMFEIISSPNIYTQMAQKAFKTKDILQQNGMNPAQYISDEIKSAYR